jgi:hypothetical protein
MTPPKGNIRAQQRSVGSKLTNQRTVRRDNIRKKYVTDQRETACMHKNQAQHGLTVLFCLCSLDKQVENISPQPAAAGIESSARSTLITGEAIIPAGIPGTIGSGQP